MNKVVKKYADQTKKLFPNASDAERLTAVCQLVSLEAYRNQPAPSPTSDDHDPETE